MNSEFIAWVEEQRKRLGWSQSELARRAGMNQSGLSMALNGQRNFGPEMLEGLAHAFNVPLENVYRLAKYLPPENEKDERIKEIEYIYSKLTSEQDKDELLQQSRLRLRLQEERPIYGGRASPKPKIA